MGARKIIKLPKPYRWHGRTKTCNKNSPINRRLTTRRVTMIPSFWQRLHTAMQGHMSRTIDSMTPGFHGVSFGLRLLQIGEAVIFLMSRKYTAPCATSFLSVVLLVFFTGVAFADHPRIDRAYTTAASARDACLASMAAHNHPPESGINAGCPTNDYSIFPRYYYLIYCVLPSYPDGSSHCATEHFYFPTPDSTESQCELSGTYPNYTLICSTPPDLTNTDKNLGPSCNGIGNPCNPATGNKHQIETDIPQTGAVPALIRNYNSQLPKDFNTGFGWSWDSNKHFENITATSLLARRPDGQGLIFRKINNVWQPDADIGISLTQDATGFTLTLRDGSVERYNTVGVLASTTTAQGLTTIVTGGGNPGTTDVIGPFGHKLTYVNGTNNDIATITTPANEVIRYSYDANKNLIQVTYPDNTAKLYHYEDTTFLNHLTGISYVDSAGVTTRYSTYAYDTSGKAITTQRAQTDNGAPQEKFTLAYDSDTQTTVTDPVN